ncbi:hypothetical protein [Acholeplasma granularum]|uniref:hypothetical protein n=1 Tax=Acholeplasma granularum TaxID=264635 RepID=UPI00046E64FE|nr:hypothetical protein [Acholeplasma granularum]
MRKAIKLYALITQFILNLILGGILGAILGKNIDPDGTGEALYAGVGLIIGLFVSMILLWQFFRNERISKINDDK